MMEQKNPLRICLIKSPSSNCKSTNKSGRPTIKNEIKFSQQPKSIVAQMLYEMKTKDSNIVIESEDEIICLADEQELSEDDKLEDLINQTCPLRNDNKEVEGNLTTHKQFMCDYPLCTYSCKLSSNLIKHKRVHTNEKPYLCDQCPFRSNFVNSLKAHKRIHTSDRPYQCVYCSYKCNTSSNLKKHCRHRHSGPERVVV